MITLEQHNKYTLEELFLVLGPGSTALISINDKEYQTILLKNEAVITGVEKSRLTCTTRLAYTDGYKYLLLDWQEKRRHLRLVSNETNK